MCAQKGETDTNEANIRISVNNRYVSRKYASGELPEDPQLAQAQILQQVQRACEEHGVTRPTETAWKEVLKLLISCLGTVLAMLAVRLLFHRISGTVYLWLCIVAAVVWCSVHAKRVILILIILYQKYAPEEIRTSCLFEPCCSEYMKLAIEKYGVRTGVWKGIKRICRCHYPNGGIDNP